MYKGIDAVNEVWLLYDNGHFHAITDIKKFLNVDVFCTNCFGSFPKKEQAEGHDCTSSSGCTAGVITRKKAHRPFKFPKDRAHYLKRREAKLSEDPQRYIIFDTEADPTTIHIPNHVNAKVYLVPGCMAGATPEEIKKYVALTDRDCLIEEHNFYGLDCIDKFCDKFLLKPYEAKQTKKKKKSRTITV